MKPVPVIKFGKPVADEPAPAPPPVPRPRRVDGPRDVPPAHFLGLDGAGVMRAVNERNVHFTHELDHLGATFFGADKRSTTSSRFPGRKIEGTVRHTREVKLVRCECGTMRMDLGGPHSPMLIGHDLIRDCMGRHWMKRGGLYVRSDA